MRIAIALLALVPVVATAQVRGGDPDAGGGIGSSYISKRNVEKFNPVKFLLDQRKVLALTDAQRTALEQLGEPVRWNIGKLTARIDSAQKDMEDGRTGMRRSPVGGDDAARTPEENRQRVIAGRNALIEAVAELRRENEQASADALKVLTDAQRTKVADLMKKREDELARILADAGFTRPRADK